MIRIYLAVGLLALRLRFDRVRAAYAYRGAHWAVA